jgi:iron only hydrogenase large subunit-like protein
MKAKKLIEEIKNGRNDLHFVEIMACEGGCINGGGQPIGTSEKDIKARQKTLYESDDKETIRVAHKNPQIIELYQKHLVNPLSESSYPLLHTTYCKRDVLL